ncbi:MAG: TetR family transcriptional regulator [Selenomonadaceae bacterium]|nr:TetR family transcriptional regulator [Selenomonadaceae bacterium]
MKNKIIAAALKEMEIHSLRFTMEDLTRRLHIGRNSLYKVVSSKDALIKSDTVGDLVLYGLKA